MSTLSLVLFIRERKGTEFETNFGKFQGEKEGGKISLIMPAANEVFYYTSGRVIIIAIS